MIKLFGNLIKVSSSPLEISVRRFGPRKHCHSKIAFFSSSQARSNSNSASAQNDHSPVILDPKSFSDPNITQSIISNLQSKGFTTFPSSTQPVLSSCICNTLKETTIPNLFRGEFDTNIYPDEWHWREGISRMDAAREMCNAWKSSRMVASIVLSEKLGQVVARIMGWESVRIAQDDIVWKVPQQQQSIKKKNRIDTVGFHQDSAYISNQFEPYGNNSVTVWIALDDADEDNGCLEYAVGSHKWRPILHHQDHDSTTIIKKDDEIAFFHNSDETSYRNSIVYAAKIAGGVDTIQHDENNNNDISPSSPLLPNILIESAPVKMGHAVLHHQDIWHGSGPNLSSTRHRRALVAHYLRGDVTFVENDSKKKKKYDNNPLFGRTSYIYGRYKRYNEVDVDETFFPIIYAEPGGQNGQQKTEWIDKYIQT